VIVTIGRHSWKIQYDVSTSAIVCASKFATGDFKRPNDFFAGLLLEDLPKEKRRTRGENHRMT
jgi:hypothetical protein